MKKYLDIKEFSLENLETSYEEIVQRSFVLIKEVACKRNIEQELEKCVDLQDLHHNFYNIASCFERNNIAFKTVSVLFRQLELWEEDPEDIFALPKKEKIKLYVNLYNRIVKELELYESIKKEIQEKGYEALKKEKIEKLITLFEEMFRFKNKSYRLDWNFEEWIAQVDEKYHFFHDFFKDTIDAVNSHYRLVEIEDDSEEMVFLDEVEIIETLNSLYEVLEDEEDGYKQNAYFYPDFDLKEGQTYEEFYQLEIDKFVILFQELLKIKGVKWKAQDFLSLLILVKKEYPDYGEILFSLQVCFFSPSMTYIQKLDIMKMAYEELEKMKKGRWEK